MIASGLQIYGAFPHFGPRGRRLPAEPVRRQVRFPHWCRLGGWLAGGLNWHFALAWPFVLSGLALPRSIWSCRASGASLLFRPRDVAAAPSQMQLYYLRLRKEHPPQGKHNALQKGGLHLHPRSSARSRVAHRLRDLQAGAARAGSPRSSAATSWPATGTSGRSGSSSPSPWSTSPWSSWSTPRRCGR